MKDNELIYKLPEVRVYLKEVEASYETDKINSVDEAVRFAKKLLKDCDREHTILVTFTTKGLPINYHTISIGGLNSAVVDIKSIMKVALLSNAYSIMLFHNHPSGEATPSKEDVGVTEGLKNACNLMQLKLLDHIIVAGDSYYSFNEHKFL